MTGGQKNRYFKFKETVKEKKISRKNMSPSRGHGNLHQYSCLENPHGQRILAGYSPWGLSESNTTEQLNTKGKKIERKNMPTFV